MQVLLAKTQIFITFFLLLLLAGCADTAVTPSPTSIAASTAQVISTPTSAFATPIAATPSLEGTGTDSAVVATPTLKAGDANPTATTPALEPTLPPGLTSIGDPYTPELGNSGYDVQQYTLQMILDPAVTNIEATVTIEALASRDNLDELALDFIGFEITSLQVNDSEAAFQREDDKLLVALPQPLAMDEAFNLTISYQGPPEKRPSPYVGFASSLGMIFVDDSSLYVLSEPDGARYWFPANDHPRDKAFFRFELTAPADLTAVANGQLLNVQENENSRTFTWEHNFPMATYLATVAVGEYERLDGASPDGVPLRHYYFPDVEEAFETAVTITGEALDWMSDRFGPYPFEAFGFVTANVPGASLETQTMVILSNNMIGQRTVLHELAHMWFGNWVSLDSWSEMWRNEGFATYVSLLWEYRDDPEGLDLQIEAIRSAVADNGPQYPLGNPPPESLFGFNTYFKGALLVHELRLEIGDDAFFTGLRAYFEQYGGGTASDAEFQAVMEEAAGKSLDAFFTEWLN